MADIVNKLGALPVEVYQGYSNEDIPPDILYGQPPVGGGGGFSFTPTMADVPTIGLSDSSGSDTIVVQFPQQDGRAYYNITFNDGEYINRQGYGRFGGRVWASYNVQYVAETVDYRYSRFDYKVSQDISNDSYGQGILTYSRRSDNRASFTMPNGDFPIPDEWNDAPRGGWSAAVSNGEWCMFTSGMWNSVYIPGTTYDFEYQGYTFAVKAYADTSKPSEQFWAFTVPPVLGRASPSHYLDPWLSRTCVGTIHNVEDGDDVFYTLIYLVQYDTHTPEVPPLKEYRLYRWKPAVDMAHLNFSYKVLELSDPTDNSWWNRSSDFSTGFFNPSRTTIHGATKTFIFTGSDGTGNLKWFMAPYDFSYYVEMLPQGMDDKSVTALAQLDVYKSIGFDKEGRPMVTARMAYPWYQEVILGIAELPPKPVSGDVTIRAFSFSLDDHDFYVLRLGKQSTRVFDTTTGQSYKWASAESTIWAINTGTQWAGGIGKAGSNIVVGDDTTGNLYWLEPGQVFDEAQSEADPDQYFQIQATTYQSVRGRAVLPCYNVYLSCDFPGSLESEVVLEYSDNEGKSFVAAGRITAAEGQAANEYSWRSLGQITAPGRVYRITSNGIASRFNGLEVNDGTDTEESAAS